MVLTIINKFVTQGSVLVELVPTDREKLNQCFLHSTNYFGQLAVKLRQLADVADDADVANVADVADDANPLIGDVPVEVHC